MTDASPSLDLQQIRISSLSSRENVEQFRCGESEIDKWVAGDAYKHHEDNRIKVFGAFLPGNDRACGLYTLAVSSESSAVLKNRYKEIYKTSGIPLIYIGYLAVLRSCQRQQLGSFLLMNALRRCYFIAQNVAFYGVALRSLNENTTRLYGKYGFGKATEGQVPLMILPIWTLYDLHKTLPSGSGQATPHSSADSKSGGL